MNELPDMSHIALVGLPWFEPGSYAEVCALMADADKLFGTYAQWHTAAQRTEDQVRRSGARTVRVLLDLVQFPAWCATHRPGLHINAQARMDYASFIAHKQHLASQSVTRH